MLRVGWAGFPETLLLCTICLVFRALFSVAVLVVDFWGLLDSRVSCGVGII